MKTPAEPAVPQIPDAPQGRSRTRLIVIGLVTVACMGTATYALLRLQECRQPKQGFATMSIPGARLQVPRWPISKDERRSIPGQVVLRSADGSGHLSIRWVPGFRDSWDKLEQLYRLPGHVERKEAWVSTHLGQAPLWSSVHKSSGRPVAQSTWLCERPFVRYFFYMRRGTGQKAFWKGVRRILKSVRCDTATLANVRLRRLPIYDCRECGFNRIHDGSLVGVGTARDVHRQHYGHFGRLSPAQKAAEIMKILRVDLPVRDREGRERQVVQALASETPGRLTVHTYEGRSHQNKKTRLHWTVFYCPAVDQTFIATLTSDSDAVLAMNQERRSLGQVRCPEKKTISEVLTEMKRSP